jgi:hypothetical protein
MAGALRQTAIVRVRSALRALRPEVHNIMDVRTKATATQPAEGYEKMSAATAEATDLIKGSYSTAVKGAQDYNNKLLEFAQTNTNTTFELAKRLLDEKSPSEFIELSTEC